MMNASRGKRDDGDALIPPDGDGEDSAEDGVVSPIANGDTRVVAPTNTIPVAGFRAYLTVGILFSVNLLNYVDRYTVAGLS